MMIFSYFLMAYWSLHGLIMAKLVSKHPRLKKGTRIMFVCIFIGLSLVGLSALYAMVQFNNSR